MHLRVFLQVFGMAQAAVNRVEPLFVLSLRNAVFADHKIQPCFHLGKIQRVRLVVIQTNQLRRQLIKILGQLLRRL